MGLFKYLPLNRIDVFALCRIRFTQPAIFNDPFEATPHYTGIAPTAELEAAFPRRFEQVLKDEYDALSPQMKAEASFQFFRDHFESMRSEIYDIFRQVNEETREKGLVMMNERFGKRIGVLSLAENCDSLLMWAHYADSHSGYLIEFDETHPFFSENSHKPDDLWRLHKVEYAIARPKTTIAELDLAKILLTKSFAWEYEREWRMLKPLNAANHVLPGNPLPVHLFDIPAASMKAVILGARTPKLTQLWFREKIKLHKTHGHIKLRCADLDGEHYQLRFRAFDN